MIRLSRLFWLVCCCCCAAASASAQVTASFTARAVDPADQTTYTFSNVDIGAAASDRYIAVFVMGRRFASSSCTLSSGTIDGAAATLHATQEANTTSGNCAITSLLYTPAAVTSGTTTTITVTYPATMARVSIAVLRLTSVLSITPVSVVSNDAAAPSGNMTIQPYSVGAGVAQTHNASTTGTTWTGLTEQFDELAEGTQWTSGALLTPTTRQSSLSISATFAGGNTDSTGLWAAWGRIGPAFTAANPSHWVTENGSSSSFCEQSDPCNITRADALLGGSIMPPGSYVTVAAGVYSQDEITWAGSGTQAFPIKIVGAGTTSRFTGTRTKVTPDAGYTWTLTSGMSYTYETDFDDAALYIVTMMAQRLPVPGWQPIVVDDRSPPFTTTSFRVYSYDYPMRFRQQSSIAAVEAMHCSFAHATTTNKLYVHTCDEGPPTNAENLYAGSTGWGEQVVTGDYLWFEGFQYEHARNQTLLVQESAAGFTLKNIVAIAAQIWVKGTNFTVENIDASHVAEQSTPITSPCYDANPTFGEGECWNESGDGFQLLLGEGGDSVPFGTATNLFIHQGWNGMTFDGNVDINGMYLWGFANHAVDYSGSGGSVTNMECANTQDCFQATADQFDNLTVTHSLFFGAFWITSDYNGDGSCCTPPTSVTLNYNIFGNVLTSTEVYPHVTSDCNIYMPRSAAQSSIWRATAVTGVPGADTAYDTLTDVRAGTAWEDNSIQNVYSKWYDNSIFATWDDPEDLPSNGRLGFTLADPGGAAALTVCGVQAGPTDLGSQSTEAQPMRLRFRTP